MQADDSAAVEHDTSYEVRIADILAQPAHALFLEQWLVVGHDIGCTQQHREAVSTNGARESPLWLLLWPTQPCEPWSCQPCS